MRAKADGGYLALLRRAEDKLVPLSVSLELTDRCTFRCVHCVVPDRRAADGLSTARLLRLEEELAEMGTLFLTFTGGEVLLRPDWYELARRARQLGFSLRLFTNAWLVDPQVADAIAGLQAAVEVSLYSLEPAVFERVTGVAGSLERTLAGVELLRSRGVQLRLKAPAMTLNLNAIGAVAAYARSTGAEFHTDPRIMSRADGDSGPTRLRVNPGELAAYYRASWSPQVAPSPAMPRPSADDPVCAAATRVATVTATGDLLACSLLRTPAGNLGRSSFRDLWFGSEWLQSLRRLRVRDLASCTDCHRLPYCQRCPAQALVEDGDLLGPSRWSCEYAAALEMAFADPR